MPTMLVAGPKERADMRIISRLLAIICLLTAILTTGCSQAIGHLMVCAPNQGCTDADLGESPKAVLDFWGVDRQFRVQVGPPDASLLTWVIDPIAKDGGHRTPKGTVLVLHGYRDEMEWFTCKARMLARHGYRTVLVDLRGHGDSTGEYLTFGVQESRDIVRVIDALQSRGEIVGSIGVWGMSYGASTAIMAGARDDRIRAVVAVSPFDTMRRIVPHFVRLLVPGPGWMMSDKEIDAIVTSRGREAGFDPDEADAIKAGAAGRSPLLLVHGSWDAMVPAACSERIEQSARSAGRQVRRVTVPLTGHVSMYFDIAGAMEDESVAWFDRWLASAP